MVTICVVNALYTKLPTGDVLLSLKQFQVEQYTKCQEKIELYCPVNYNFLDNWLTSGFLSSIEKFSKAKNSNIFFQF